MNKHNIYCAHHFNATHRENPPECAKTRAILVLMIHEMRREMSRYTWKPAIYIAMTMIAVIGGCLWGM